jgi:hypothetical protein
VQEVVKDDGTTDWRPKPGAPPNVVQQIREVAARQEQLLRKFAKDPKALLDPIFGETVKERLTPLEKRLAEIEGHLSSQQDAFSQNAQQRVLSDWLTDNQGTLFKAGVDLKTTPAQEALAKLTPAGKEFQKQMHVLTTQHPNADAMLLVETAILRAKDAVRATVTPANPKGKPVPVAKVPVADTKEEAEQYEGLGLAEMLQRRRELYGE